MRVAAAACDMGVRRVLRDPVRTDVEMVVRAAALRGVCGVRTIQGHAVRRARTKWGVRMQQAMVRKRMVGECVRRAG